MRILSILLLCAAFALSSFAQVNDSAYRAQVRKDLLKKSRNQRTTGFVLAGAGVAITLIGVISTSNSVNNPSDNLWDFAGDVAETGLGAGVVLVGSLVAVSSIPFFIMSGSNKKKANKLSAGISFQRMMRDKVSMPCPNYYPALTARLNF